MQAPRAGRARPAPAGDAALAAALIAGGDARLALDPTSGLNPYGCRPLPRPDEISLSSSTASTISSRGFTAAQAAFARLEEARERGTFASVFAETADELRAVLRRRLGLPDAEIVLSPSGTDSALQALFLARGLLGKPVTSIVVAADESGNGVPAAASGRHFAVSASGGRAVAKGAPVTGLGCAAVTIAARDGQGRARPPSEVDAEVLRAVEAAIRTGNGIVLHVMDHSKLGSRAPSLACLHEICAVAPADVQVVIDACQLRLSRARLRWYLDRGFLVLVTGSKFFTGPPLSGGLIVPEALWARAARIGEVPAGLADYAARDDWPSGFAGIRDRLPARHNIGQLLRWTAASEDIRAYSAVPELFRTVALAEFAAAAVRTIERFPEVALVADEVAAPADHALDGGEFAARTIFPFTVTHAGRPLALAQARALHRALNLDLTRSGLPGAPDTAAALCHIGQPVPVGDGTGGTTGALRISADARLVSDSWVGAGDLVSTGRLTRRLDQIATVFEKLRFLLPHLDRLEGLGPS
ncbi:MAG TPA: hypothetical protein VLX44_00930 [Xanthobacteraceae bacterium]|nr:hypothetical protein [Xanthobacteraceae bacterium]